MTPRWPTVALRRVGRSASGSGFPDSFQGKIDLEYPFFKVKALGMPNDQGVIRQAADTVDGPTASQLGATVFHKDTLVFAKVGAALLLGRVRMLGVDACLDNNLCGFVCNSSESARYYYYVLATLNFDQIVNPGAVPSLSDKNLMSYRVPRPSLADQVAIADYLDRETARIDALIEKQRQLIVVLRERRHAVIERAVTQGINAGAPTMPSGLRWPTLVPSHWRVANIRRFAEMKTGHTPSRSIDAYWVDCTIPWLTLADVWQLRDGRRLYVSEVTNSAISELGLMHSAAELLPAGTVVLSRTASVGFSGMMPVPMATSQDYWNWICGPNLKPEYLVAIFRAMRDEFQMLVMGSTHKTIYQPVAAAISIAVPPLSEQADILGYLDDQIRMIDDLSDKVRRHIEVALERRSALITAAVTGEIDLRSAA